MEQCDRISDSKVNKGMTHLKLYIDMNIFVASLIKLLPCCACFWHYQQLWYDLFKALSWGHWQEGLSCFGYTQSSSKY